LAIPKALCFRIETTINDVHGFMPSFADALAGENVEEQKFPGKARR
jgi:hypothetical protein